MRSEERLLSGADFERRKATADTRRKVEGWEIWECTDVAFSHDYDRTVTLFVQQGRATVSFDGGESVEIEPGDTLMIRAGTSATWAIEPPIRNHYCYHDSFSSADDRTDQIHWQDKET